LAPNYFFVFFANSCFVEVRCFDGPNCHAAPVIAAALTFVEAPKQCEFAAWALSVVAAPERFVLASSGLVASGLVALGPVAWEPIVSV